MKIILLTKHLDYGGIPIYTISLAKGLQKRGHRVLVVSSGGALVAELDKGHITHKQIDINTKSEISPKVFSAVRELRKIVKQEKPDIIHAQTRVIQVVSFLVSKLTGVPYASTCHGFFKPRLSRILFPCWGNKVIAISEAVRKHLINKMRVKKDNVRLIYNGIDTEKFTIDSGESRKGELRGEFGLKGGPVIGIIGRLSPVKGHKFLLMAMKQVLEKRPKAQLLIVGEGKIKKDLICQAEKLGIINSIVFSDSISDTRRALAVMDVFVLSSLEEGLGLAILEAMAMGKPVVASNVGGIKTAVRHNETGFLVPAGNSAGLCEAILRLLDNPELAKEMGEAGCELVKEKFSLDETAGKVEEVYREVVKRA